jgi:MFS family permease
MRQINPRCSNELYTPKLCIPPSGALEACLPTDPLKNNEFSSGWPVMSAAAVGIGLGMSPLPFYTLGVMAGPIMKEFGWGLADVFLAFPIYTLTAFFMAPLVGLLADKFGARRVSLTSIILFGFAMMAQGLHTGDKYVYGALWALVSIFGAGTLPVTFTRAVNNAFDRHRGKALGIALIATGMFGTLAKYYAQEVLTIFDWRTAYFALGLLPILIAFPMALLCMRDLEDTPARDSALTRYKGIILLPAITGFIALAWLNLRFILPQIEANGLRLEYAIVIPFLIITGLPLLAFTFGKIGTEPIVHIKAQTGHSLSGLTLKQSLYEWRLWLICLCLIPISYALGSAIPNLEQILGSRGFSSTDAVALAGLTGLAVLGGRLIGGFLIDQFWAPGVAFVFLSSPAIALYLLAAPEVSADSARVAILMIGFGAGVEYDFLAYLVSKYFGMRSYSAIYGFLYAFFALGAGFGPQIMAQLASSGPGWESVLTNAAVLLVIGSLPLLALGKYRDFSSAR